MIPYFSPHWSSRTDTFEVLPKLVSEAAYGIHAKTKGADPGLIRAQILAFMAAAAAPLYRITMPSWHPIPLAIKVTCIGRSGVGKSPVFLELYRPFQEFASTRKTEFARELTEHTNAETVRSVKVKALQRELSRKIRNREETHETEDQLKAVSATPPPPKLRCRLANGIDYERLVYALDGDNEAVDFLFNEGDQALNSVLIKRRAGLFNDLHDGVGHLESPQQRRRSARATNANLAMLFLVRESALAPYKPIEQDGNLRKSQLVDMGFFARGLVYFSDQLPIASGLYAPAEPDGAIESFNGRIYKMLTLHHARLASGDTARIELRLAADAIPVWNEINDEIRYYRNCANSWIDEFHGKVPSLIARVAALLHVFESDSLFVSLSALQRAYQIVGSHTEHYQRAFAPPLPAPSPQQAEVDVYALGNLLRERFQQAVDDNYEINVGTCEFRLNMSQRRVLRAAATLEDWGQVSISARRDKIDFQNLMKPVRNITQRW